jgi:hypothetical protein
VSERQSYEKSEKDVYKREEKGGDEKNWEEKWRRDPLNAATWAIIIIWIGLVLLADNLFPGFLYQLRFTDAWGLIFVGMGAILLVEVLVRIIIPDFRKPLMGNIIFAVIMLGVGLTMNDLFDWSFIWAFALIGVGLGALLQGIFRSRR